MKFYKTNEIFNFTKDSLTKSKRPVYSDKEFDDPHVHWPIPKNEKEFEGMLDIVFSSGVDRCGMTSWGHIVDICWDYNDFVNDVENYKGEYEIEVKGVVTNVKYHDKEILIVKSQENYTKKGVHITAEGCKSNFPQRLNVEDLIERIYKEDGNKYVEHPGTKNKRILQYWFTNKKEREFIKSLFPYVEGVEIFNATNSLWMCMSNGLAKKMVDEYNQGDKKITAVAGSDAHFYLFVVGYAGIYLPKHDLKSLTDKEIIAQKRQDLKNEKILLYEHYLDPREFWKSMVKNPYKVK